MNNIKPLTVVSLIALTSLTGCQQYHNRSEGVTTFAGNSHAVNEAKMVVDPWPKYLDDTDFDTDGERLSAAVKRYKSGGIDADASTSTTPAALTAPSTN